jgi:hypothetical protein
MGCKTKNRKGYADLPEENCIRWLSKINRIWLLDAGAWRRTVKDLAGLFGFAGERFGGESRKPSEEGFGEGFLLFGRKFQVVLDFGFQVLKFF